MEARATAWTPEPSLPTYAACAAVASDGRECDRPALCTRCLQTWGCMIDSYGFCVTQGGNSYNKDADFRHAADSSLILPDALTANPSLLTNRQYWHFRAGDVTYCNRSDTVCQQCAQAKFWTAGRPRDTDSRYCVGAGGCVCIFNCEFSPIAACDNATQETAIEPSSTSTPVPSAVPTVQEASTWTGDRRLDVAVKVLLIVCLFGVPLVVGYRLWTKRRQQKLANDGFVQTLDTPDPSSENQRAPRSLPMEA